MATISGTSGADVIGPTVSGDVLTGGAGADVFVYSRTVAQASVSDFGSVYFTANLSAQQESPPNPSAATGTFTGVLNRARTDFHFAATVTGLDLAGQTQSPADNVLAAHFHNGPPGSAGGIVFGFLGSPNNDADATTVVDPTTGAVTGDWFVNEGNGTTLTAQVPNLLAGQIYINFHTPVNPAGEIRGQIAPVDTGADVIDLRAAHIGDFESLSQVMKPLGASTIITTTLNGQVSNLVIQGVPTTSLTANDFIFADATPTNIVGNAGADDLFGAGGNDTIAASDGNDRVFAAGGDDKVDGGSGADTILGQSGNDSVTGGAGDDSLQGNQGADSLDGGDGADQVFGGKGADTLMGGIGNDTLSGDVGDDILFGGAGADRFVLRAGGGHDWIGDWNSAEGDRIVVSAGTTFTVQTYLNQAIITLSTGDTIGLAGVPPSAFTNDLVVFG